MADKNTQISMAQADAMPITAYMTNASIQKGIAETIGRENVSRFVSSIVSAVQATPALKECTNSSILSGAILGESLKLAPSPQLGQFYLVPYKDSKSKTTQAQFQLGWKGYVQLATRSGQYEKLVVSPVKEGELESYNPITEEFVLNPIQNESERQKAKTIGYYAMFKQTNGFIKEIYWSREKMEAHAKQYSSGYRNDLSKGTKYTFWSKDFDAMACKTMIRQLISKWGIMSIDMQRAYEGDMAVIREDGTPDYVDNQKAPEEVIDVVHTEVKENQNSIPFDVED